MEARPEGPAIPWCPPKGYEYDGMMSIEKVMKRLYEIEEKEKENKEEAI